MSCVSERLNSLCCDSHLLHFAPSVSPPLGPRGRCYLSWVLLLTTACEHSHGAALTSSCSSAHSLGEAPMSHLELQSRSAIFPRTCAARPAHGLCTLCHARPQKSGLGYDWGAPSVWRLCRVGQVVRRRWRLTVEVTEWLTPPWSVFHRRFSTAAPALLNSKWSLRYLLKSYQLLSAFSTLCVVYVQSCVVLWRCFCWSFSPAWFLYVTLIILLFRPLKTSTCLPAVTVSTVTPDWTVKSGVNLWYQIHIFIHFLPLCGFFLCFFYV